MEISCHDLAPDMVSRCGRDLDHVGVHENWYGTWYNGVWFTRYEHARPAS